MAVLKVARQLNLVRELDRVAVPGYEPMGIPEALLQRAIEHGDESLLVDAMALVCSHPKSTAVPGATQVQLMFSAACAAPRAVQCSRGVGHVEAM